MIGYTASVVLFWVGVVVFTLGGCWLLDKITLRIGGWLDARRPYITRPDR